ncbi:MAG: queuosine precursor transporter [Gammaproteobacteria bacterium]|nr:queuosine precursor transporter [Gammaproteobacteria bacterium]
MTTAHNQPRYLFILMLAYCVCILLANWFDPRLVSIFGLITDAGTLIFPIGFLLSDLITEVYGYKKARQAIWLGFIFNVVFLLYGQLVIHLPSPAFANHNAEFDQLVQMDLRVVIGSFCSYLIAEPINSWMIARLKLRMKGRHMALRFLSSTIVASLLDSSIFSVIAFSGIMPTSDLRTLILTMWFIKIVIEMVGLPLSTYLADRLKQTEHLDIYDINTKFSLLRFDAEYEASANHYKPSVI